MTDAQNDANQEEAITQTVEGAQPEAEEQQASQTAALEAKVAELEASLAKAEAKVDEQKDSVVRAKAEVDNIRRRAATDVDKAKKFALEKFTTELLPVIDNLERAITFADAENEQIKPILDGINLTHQSFIASINKFGLEVVNPEGETFNPDLHQAMSIQENAEVAANTVLAVMQKGYTLNGRLIRPAMVMVSKAPEDSVDTSA